ncbi:hypothetical protein BH23GEM3_BH23GEM3_24910 [soil metagenome]
MTGKFGYLSRANLPVRGGRRDRSRQVSEARRPKSRVEWPGRPESDEPAAALFVVGPPGGDPVNGVRRLLLSYWLLRRARVPMWGTNRRLLVLRGLLGFGALACFYYARVHLPLAEATVIQYTKRRSGTCTSSSRASGESCSSPSTWSWSLVGAAMIIGGTLARRVHFRPAEDLRIVHRGGALQRLPEQ